MKKELIICNLKQLSSYITKDIQMCDSGIEHWKSRIRTYGADAKIYGAGTYEEHDQLYTIRPKKEKKAK